MATSAVAGLADAVKGRVIEVGESGYDEARAVYNGMVDKRPAAITFCADEQDVAAAIGFARNGGLQIAVLCGGHSASGWGAVDDGIALDLSALDAVAVD